MTVLPRYRPAFSVLVSDGEVVPGRRVDRVLEMIMVMLLFSNKNVMGPLTKVSKLLRALGWLATAAMTAAAVALFL